VEIRILEPGKRDLIEGWSFFERQAPGLGDYFLDSIHTDLQSLLLYAGIHESANGYHRMLAKRFPFGIYYLIENERIDVYAFLDCRQDPESIRRRLGSIRPRE